MKQLPYPNTVNSDMMDTPPNAVTLVSGSQTYPEIRSHVV